MALITCKECGREVSSAAKTCPHCGAPLKTEEPDKSNFKTYMIISIILAIGSGIAAISSFNQHMGGDVEIQDTLLIMFCVISIVAAIVCGKKAK